MMSREGRGHVVGGGGGEGGGVSSCSMRGELLVGRYQRVSGMPFQFTADQQRFWNPFPKTTVRLYSIEATQPKH